LDVFRNASKKGLPMNLAPVKHWRYVLPVASLLLASFGIGHARGDDDLAQFIGMWRLVSWEQRLADGTTRQAPNSVGYIVYTDVGRMCYVGMNPNRPKWKSLTPTESEALSGIVGMGAYCALVELHAREGFVLHHVDIERVPNNVGIVRKRWFTFDGINRLTLKVDARELIPPIVESTLTWERITK
jgi:hypothetical protein